MRPIRFVCVAALLAVFAAQPDQRLSLTGKVTDGSTKKPIPDFHLVLRRGTLAEPKGTVIDRKVHNASGRFTAYVPSGPIALTVESSGYLPLKQVVSGGGRPLAIALQRGWTLQGRVLGPDGKPLPHVDVTTEFFS